MDEQSAAVSGYMIYPDQEQYRGQTGLLNYDPLFRPDYHSHPTPSSAIRELHMTGSNTWDRLYNLDYDLERREIVGSQQPQVVINYVVNNPASMVEPAPIPIAQYAVNTGLIYVGANAGNFGGIQVGTISGGPSGY